MTRGELPLSVRTHPVVLGVVIFIASETMFFSSLFASYFNLKAHSAAWPAPHTHLDVLGATFGTAFLVFSSAMMFPMQSAMRRRDFRAASGWIFAAIVGGLGYTGDALHGYAHQTFTFHSSAYGSIYIAMTGFHLLHVVAGVLMLMALFLGIRSPAFRVDKDGGAEAVSYYWHFVTVMWFGIYTTLYWVR